MFAVTGATGQLGDFVIESLLERVPANQIIGRSTTTLTQAVAAALRTA